MAESGDWKGAIKLYKEVESSLKKKPSVEHVLLQMDLGRLYYLTEQFPEAAAEFQKVMEALDKPKDFGLDVATRKELLGEDGSTYELVGNVMLEAKRPDDARAAFEQFNKLKPDAPILALNLARTESVAGHPEKALEELQKYFDSKNTTKGIVPYELLAAVLKDQKQTDQLIPKLESLLTDQPDNVPLAYFLGEQYRQDGKLDKAQPPLEKSVALKINAQAYRALSGCVLTHRSTRAAAKTPGQNGRANRLAGASG